MNILLSFRFNYGWEIFLLLSATLVECTDMKRVLKAARLPRSSDKAVRVQQETLDPDHKTCCVQPLCVFSTSLFTNFSLHLMPYFGLIEIHWRLKVYVINGNLRQAQQKCQSVVSSCKWFL